MLALAASAFSGAFEYFDPNPWLPSPRYIGLSETTYPSQMKVSIMTLDPLSGRGPAPPLGGTFTSTLPVQAVLTFTRLGDPPQTFQCPGDIRVFMHTTSEGPPRVIQTEMLQMNLTGGTLPQGVIVRESPVLVSPGVSTIRTVQGGYMISSFFDVFTELSMDGGQTWHPGLQPMRLQGVPEPGSAAALAVGMGSLLLRARRRRSPEG